MALTVLKVHFLGPVPSVEGQMVPQVMGGFTVFPRAGESGEKSVWLSFQLAEQTL